MAEIKYKCTDLGRVKTCYDKSRYNFVDLPDNKKIIYEKRKSGKEDEIGMVKFNGLRTVTVEMIPLKGGKPRQLDMSFFGDSHDNIFSIANAKRYNANFSQGGLDVDSYFERNCHPNSVKGAEIRASW